MTPRASQVRVVCTDKGTHASRELDVLTLTDDPELLEVLLEGAAAGEYSEAEARAQYEYERINGTTTRSSKRKGANAAVVARRVSLERDALTGSLYRFVCPTCRRDVPLSQEKLAVILEHYAHAGRVSFDISLLPANLRSN